MTAQPPPRHHPLAPHPLQPPHPLHPPRPSPPYNPCPTPTPLPPTTPQLFTEAFSRDNQLIWAEPRQHTFLATALMLRGSASIGDVQRNVARLRPSLKFAHWNEEVRGGQGGRFCLVCLGLLRC